MALFGTFQRSNPSTALDDLKGDLPDFHEGDSLRLRSKVPLYSEVLLLSAPPDSPSGGFGLLLVFLGSLSTFLL